MGLFFGGFDDRSIPGTRKSGFARYREVLEENWKDFIKVGFITLVFFIPLGAGLVYAVGTKSALLAILAFSTICARVAAATGSWVNRR